jgi:L-fuculose-phosphate aldolase
MVNFEEFSLVGKDLYALGLVDSCSGSLSVRSEGKIYITKRNAMLGHLKEEDIVEVPLEGDGGKDELAASELHVCRAIYRETNFNAVVHAYPPYGTALSIGIENKIIPPDAKGQAVLRSIPVVRAKAIAPGREKMTSEEIIRFLPPVFKSGYVVSLVKEYGSFAVGESLLEALRYTTCLEGSCKIAVISKSLTSSAEKQRRPEQPARRTAIPPGIGVMDRSRARGYKRGFGR